MRHKDFAAAVARGLRRFDPDVHQGQVEAFIAATRRYYLDGVTPAQDRRSGALILRPIMVRVASSLIKARDAKGLERAAAIADAIMHEMMGAPETTRNAK